MERRGENANQIRVVLAEDHHVVREALAALLSQQPDIKVVGQVAEGTQLFDVVDRLRPDVLIMDVEMPRHKPIEATKRLRRQYAVLFAISYGLVMVEPNNNQFTAWT